MINSIQWQFHMKLTINRANTYTSTQTHTYKTKKKQRRKKVKQNAKDGDSCRRM